MTEAKTENGFTDYTKYEKARMIGSRALQISMGAPFLVKLEKEDLERIHYNPVVIAKLEFNEKIIPITVRRPLPKRKRARTEEEKAIRAEAKKAKEK